MLKGAYCHTVSLYVCPMHPEMQSEIAGTCPKCGMTLERKKITGSKAGLLPAKYLHIASGERKTAFYHIFLHHFYNIHLTIYRHCFLYSKYSYRIPHPYVFRVNVSSNNFFISKIGKWESRIIKCV